MKPMTAVGTKTEMNCFFRIASSETPLRSGYTEVDVRCKFIIKLDKPFGFDPESKTPDSARRFFCFENTQDSGRNIQDKTLINQFNRITELSEENKTVVSKLIDAFLFQQEMKQKLAQ